MKLSMKALFLILLIFAVAPACGQRGDRLPASTPAFSQDSQFDQLTTKDGSPGTATGPANVVILTDEQGEYPLGLHLEILEDKDRVWTINDVTSPELDPQFVPSQDAAPNFGISDSAFWVRFTVRNETVDTTDWQLTFQGIMNLFFVDVYIPSPDQQGFMVTKTGTYLPFDTRDVKVPQYVFNVPLLPGAEQTIYLRIQSEYLITVPLALWSSDALLQRQRVELVLWGIFYGVLLITIGYNAFLYLFLRDTSYLYYVLFIACFLLQILAGDGLAQQYLWPNVVGWNAYTQPFFYVLGTALALKFTTSFLMTRVNVPKLHQLINVLIIIVPVITILITFGWFRSIGISVFILLIVCNITMVVAGLVIWRQGYRPARYYLLAWSIFLITANLIPLMGVKLLPNSLVISFGYRFGLVALVLLLSMALADRINTIRQQREDAQNKLNVALRAAKEELEEQVELRTQELMKSGQTREAALTALQKSNTELATVMSVTQDIVSVLELDKLLNLILDQFQQVMDYSGAGILISNQERLRFRAYHGVTIASEVFSLTIPVANISPLRQAIIERQPFIVDDVRQEPGLAGEFQECIGLSLDELFGEAHAWMGIPMIVGDNVIGLLACTHRVSGHYQAGDLNLAQTFANHSAIAIENSRLYEQAQIAAVTEERNRLARDLHDSVTQSIYSASLVAESLPRMWRRDPLAAEQGLEDLRHLTRGALAEMRTMLLELRPVSLVKTPLADLLKQLLEAVTNRTELQPQLDLEPIPSLPSDVHINFYRVAQEALNNVVKHAWASQVSVSLRPTPPYDSQVEREWQGQLQLTIRDDGQGFELTEIPQKSLGIGIIRERAAEINATLTIDSAPGTGTTVTLVWEKGVPCD